MVILGLDTATPATVAGLLLADGTAFEARDDPAPGERPGHSSRILELAEDVLAQAGASWDDVTRLAVGVGPGGFTGLRIGVATARALAQARGLELAGVSTLHALALAAAPDVIKGSDTSMTVIKVSDPFMTGTVLAVVDARRREVFAAAWDAAADALRLEAAAFAPVDLAAEVARLPGPVIAVGDGAVLIRDVLEDAGALVPEDGAGVHLVRGSAICRLGAGAVVEGREAVLPDYRREPDAKPPSSAP